MKKKNNLKKSQTKSKWIDIKKQINNFFKDKKKWQKIINNLHQFMVNHNLYTIILFSFPFVVMDFGLRLIEKNVTIYPLFSIAPRLFSFSYIFLLIGLVFNIHNGYNKFLYILFYSLFLILFLVNGVYYSSMDTYFDFSVLGLAGEGSSYFLDAIKNGNPWIYLITILLIAWLIINIRIFPKKDFYNKKRVLFLCLAFIMFHATAKLTLGKANFELTWDTWRIPRNIYNNFNDSKKCMAIAGFYEYTFRDFYVNFIKPEEKRNETENNFLLDVFDSVHDDFSKNNFTGKFRDKNVIFLQFEGIDNWLLTKEIMPNTYSLLNNAINFNNHYSFYNGGGSTFNSEFAVNVGYVTPFTYPQNAYSLNKNDFPYSLANLLKEKNYSIKAFHMNSSEYYSRGINYQNWGYDKYFGLKDLKTYQDNTYQLDRELIFNEIFHREMFKSSGKFANYIITYSNHLPFSSSKGVCHRLLMMDYHDKMAGMTEKQKNDFLIGLNMQEIDCIKRQAQETDYMVGLLIKSLQENDLINNTIIVAYTDHYLYTVSDKKILKDHGKDIETNLINKTPFFIYSKGMKRMNVNKVTTQLNILPTVLNLLGVDYNKKWYIGQDALDKKYRGIAIFNDLSWYDGKVYVVDGKITNGKKMNNIDLDKKNNLVEYLVKKNDLVLKYNYFKDIIN